MEINTEIMEHDDILEGLKHIQQVLPEDAGVKHGFLKDSNLIENITKYFHQNYSYANICKLLLKKKNQNISTRTLKRILREIGLNRKNLKESSMEEIVASIHIEIENSGFNLGYRSMTLRLKKEYGLIVKEKTVLKALQVIDLEGIAERKRNRLRRRMYKVPGPNYMWHLDGYDKIKRYGFAIHGCIDGFSKKILWLEVGTTNNNPKIIAFYFFNTVKKLQYLPAIIRSDKGTENSIIECLQQCLRYQHDDKDTGERSFVTGKSTANQRIEATWCQLRRHCTGFYINLFKAMKDKNILDISNMQHVECLRFCFGSMIEKDLQVFRKEWNEHHIRKQNTRNIPRGKPNVKYFLPEIFGASDCKKTVNLSHLQILEQKYCKKPSLKNLHVVNIINQVIPNVTIPYTAVDAFCLYIKLLEHV